MPSVVTHKPRPDALTGPAPDGGPRRGRAFLALCAFAVVLGCAHPTWTADIRDRYGLSNEEIKAVQFFISGKIKLRREEPYQERKIINSRLVIQDRLRVDDVVLSRGTPGVARRVEGDHILVSFSREHPDRALWFSRKKNSKGRYELSHLSVGMDEQPFVERYSPGFMVRYAAREYRVLDASSFRVYLTYEDPQRFDEGVNVEKPKGWRLR